MKKGQKLQLTKDELQKELKKKTSALERLTRKARISEEIYAREMRVEASLERVRGRAMSMMKSDDLLGICQILFEELQQSGLGELRNTMINIYDDDKESFLNYDYSWNKKTRVVKIPYKSHSVIKSFLRQAKMKSDALAEIVVTGYELETWKEFRREGGQLEDAKLDESTEIYYYFYSIGTGAVGISRFSPISKKQLDILKRFRNVFELCYRRYTDVVDAEAQASEAVKQAALDRIRADIASMRRISDLDRITPLIWNELTILGIPFIRCGVFIMDTQQQLIHTFLSAPDGQAIAAFHMSFGTPGKTRLILEHWQKNEVYMEHWKDSDFVDLANTLIRQQAIESRDQYLANVPRGGFYLHFLPFLQGMLYVGNTTQLNENEIKLTQSIANAFSTAYARYEDFNNLEAAKKQVESTLDELQAAQKQLVQSEKMASLGELTAGIAHEIQNPLNFVTNFSEVNKELIDEMQQEMDKGNIIGAKEISNHIKENEDKILLHGKRADAIVKGMLQHSRPSAGVKEPTEINALAEEYFRLSYHGLRAKDKNFNASLNTDFDKSIGKINIIPQDIGRVLLNLYNNAFYAVSEKKNQRPIGYDPTVSVSTKKIAEKIEIRVKDNGNGIPQKVVDKIFQPFFTTKPTGQGTGLGLSLSYDIIKAHGGEIMVNSKEGEGAEFIIELPA